jgi:hypothetical protein
MPAAPAQNQQFISIDNFAGGMNDSDSVYSLPPDVATRITNMLIDGKDLKTAWGTENIGTGGFDAVFTWTAQAYGQTTTMALAIKNQIIYIEELDGSGKGTGVYRPMYNAASDPETGSTNTPWAGSFAESQGYLYITGLGRKVYRSELTSDYAAGPLVFDGYAAQITTTVSSGSKTQVTLSALPFVDTYDTLAPPSMAGYKVTLTDDNGAVETRTLLYPASTGSLTFVVDSAFTNATTGKAAVVAGINYVGIEQPMGGTVSANGTVSGGTYILTLTTPDGRFSASTSALDYDVDEDAGDESPIVTALNTALDALSGYSNMTASVTGGPLPGNPITITFSIPYVYDRDNHLHPLVLGLPTITINVASLTGGGSYVVGPASILATVGNGGSLSTGAYNYYIVYANSARSITSNAGLPMTVTVSAGQKVTISGIATEPIDLLGSKWGHYQVDAVQIWRTAVGGSVYYLLTTIFRNAASYTFAATYDDTIADTALQGGGAVVWSDADNSDHDLPPALDYLIAFNASLHGYQHFIQKDWRKSGVLGSEYWPLVSPEGVTGGSDLATHGSYFEIGTFNDPIVGALPDVGSFYTDGITGSCLVIFTKTKAKRFYGSTLDNIVVVNTGLPGLLATNGAQNCDGILVWPSPLGVVCCTAGANNAVTVSSGIRNDLVNYGNVGGEGAWASAASAYWQNYYILSAPDVDGTMHAWCCYLGTDHVGGNRFAWTENSDLVSSWYHVSNANNFPGTKGGAGDLIFTDGGDILRVAPWLSTFNGGSIPIAYRKEIARLSEPANELDQWTVREVSFVVQTTATSNIDLTLKVWELGTLETDLPTGDPLMVKPKTLACNGAKFNGARRMVTFRTECLCRWPMIELSGNVSSDFRIMSMRVKYSDQGELIGE